MYLIFGTIPELSIAPTALISLLTYSYTRDLTFDNVQGAILLCFLSGCVELLCGLAHLGKLNWAFYISSKNSEKLSR